MNYKVSRPSPSSIKRMIRLYREICDEHPAPQVQRIAQAMETALRWATEETDWTMEDEPIVLAQCLADDLKRLTHQSKR